MNIASGFEVKILEMAEHVNDLTGNTAGILRVERRVWDTKKRLLASVDGAREFLGYQPAMKFDDGLKMTIDWFRMNWKNIRRDAEFPPGTSSSARGVVVKKETDASSADTAVAPQTKRDEVRFQVAELAR